MGRNVRRVLILLLTLVFILIVLFSPAGKFLQQATQPWLSWITRLSVAGGNWFNNFKKLSELAEENEDLRHRVAELLARQSTTEAMVSENEELRRLLNLPLPTGYEFLTVEIIGQQVDETGISYLINRGSIDGLQTGLAVVAGTSGYLPSSSGIVLVGTVKKVGQHTASLTLITSPASEILAKLAQESTGQSLAVGEYNLAVRLKFLEIDQAVSVGDAVVTSNLNRLIPPGILIGNVTTVERQEGELFQSAVVSPPVVLEKFRFLYILKPLEKN